MLDTNKLIDDYFEENSWRTKENANMSRSISGMEGHLIQYVNAKYVLDNILSEEEANAHKEAYIHIHDLGSGGLKNYCLGVGLEEFLYHGLNDEDGPAKHFSTALRHIENFTFAVSQEIAGAVAFNDLDIFLAPYIRNDRLTYPEVKQAIQQFVYTINYKFRIGYQSPFTNVQLAVMCPKRLENRLAMVGKEAMEFTYGECLGEAHMITKALLETLLEANRVLPFPVINLGVTQAYLDQYWDTELNDLIMRSIAEIGQPTINNYVSGDYDPDSVRSMCCSIRLDYSQLQKQSGGQFGAADNSGSVCVVTLNLPKLAYETKLEESHDIPNYCTYLQERLLIEKIDKHLALAANIILGKRIKIEELMSMGMYPNLERFVPDFANFFNTIGIIGLNEMCLNLIGVGIGDPRGQELAKMVIYNINKSITQIQEATKHWYNGRGLYWNLELVPAEGVTHRFAKHDKKQYPDIITANGTGEDYYTRGCWLPVDQEYTLAFATKHQDELQDLFSGGANFNVYLEGTHIKPEAIKNLIYKLVTKTSLPFISISPTIYICPVCGKRGEEYCYHEELKDEK